MPTINELRLLQALPLELKVMRTKQRIREWVDRFGVGGVCVSFSGGKDSTVLLHIVREIYPEVEAFFADTGLEYPEIREFVKSFENVTWVRPKMNFAEVIKKYGYPFISKEVCETVSQARLNKINGKYTYRLEKILGLAKDKNGNISRFNCNKYAPLLDLPIKFSNKCCNIMKKQPLKNVNKKYILGTLTEESKLREQSWLKNGCNSFEGKQVSQPMSFWTNEDVLQYIKTYNLSISSVYGDICETDKQGNLVAEGCGTKLTCSGCQRTGCVFCGFGAQFDSKNSGISRFVRLHATHPKLYDYCMNGGEFVLSDYYVEITNKKQLGKILRQTTRLKYKVTTKRQDYLCIRLTNGELKKVKLIWQPNKKGLGMRYVIDELNKLYSKTLKNGTVKKFIEY